MENESMKETDLLAKAEQEFVGETFRFPLQDPITNLMPNDILFTLERIVQIELEATVLEGRIGDDDSREGRGTLNVGLSSGRITYHDGCQYWSTQVEIDERNQPRWEKLLNALRAALDARPERVFHIPEGTIIIDKNSAFRKEKAFKKAERIIIPDTVTTIGEGAFAQCRALQDIRIPETVTSIGENAFGCCVALHRLDIPDSVRHLGSQVCCESLCELRIGKGVEYIGYKTVLACESLERIIVSEDNPRYCDEDGILFDKARTTLVYYPPCHPGETYAVPASVTAIGDFAFKYNGLRHIELPAGLREIGRGAFLGCSEDLQEIDLPEGIMTIDAEAFKFCKSLHRIGLSDSISSVGREAFYGCDALQRLRLPASLKQIGDGAFSACLTLGAIDVPAENEAFRSVDGILYDKAMTTLIRMPQGKKLESLAVPEGVTHIGHGALHACHSLRHVHLPASVRSIDADVFRACSRLQRITGAEGNPDYCAVDGVLYDRTQRTLVKVPLALPAEAFAVPDSVEKIAAYAFDGCDKLDKICLPDTLRSIGDYAFRMCGSLKEIDIPASVTEIGEYIFDECEMLEEIRCHLPDPGCLGEDWEGFFLICFSDSITLRVPAAAMEAYRSHPGFGGFKRIEPLPEE